MRRFPNKVPTAVLVLFLLLPAAARGGAVTAFGPGERLEYVLKWTGIPAGDSVMEIVEGESTGGEVLYKVISTATSRSFVDLIYKVRNHYESHIDPTDSLTRKYVFNMREGGKKEQRVLLFDQDRFFVTRISRKNGDTQSQIFEIEPKTQDNLSALYALRNENLEVGKSFVYHVFEGRKKWELVIDVIAAEEIEVRAGRFRTVVVHPKLKFEGIFRRKGELHVYMTDDRWHMPVLMRSKVKIGAIEAELKSFTLAGGRKEIPSLVPAEGEE